MSALSSFFKSSCFWAKRFIIVYCYPNIPAPAQKATFACQLQAGWTARECWSDRWWGNPQRIAPCPSWHLYQLACVRKERPKWCYFESSLEAWRRIDLLALCWALIICSMLSTRAFASRFRFWSRCKRCKRCKRWFSVSWLVFSEKKLSTNCDQIRRETWWKPKSVQLTKMDMSSSKYCFVIAFTLEQKYLSGLKFHLPPDCWLGSGPFELWQLRPERSSASRSSACSPRPAWCTSSCPSPPFPGPPTSSCQGQLAEK